MKTINLLIMLLGFLVAGFGIILWKKQKINWVSSHYNVKKNDVAAFTKMNGQCTIGIGVSVFLLGLFEFLNLMFVGFIIFVIGFVASMTVFFIAQNKYNT